MANGNVEGMVGFTRRTFMIPITAFDACHKRPGRVSSLSLVRYKNTDYSVPVVYAHRDVVVRAYVDEVVIEAGAVEVARHTLPGRRLRSNLPKGGDHIRPRTLSLILCITLTF